MQSPDAPGPTFLSYTPNGKQLVTVGSNGALRIFEHGSKDEPYNIDVRSENHLAVVCGDDFFIMGGEDGTVTKYSLSTREMQDILVRCTLPVRHLALSPDQQWVAVASDELEVKIVKVNDMSKVLFLRDQTKPVKHVSFDMSGSTIAASSSDGTLYMYSISSEEPQLVKRIDGLISALETDAEESAQVAWHPDGRAFAAPTRMKGSDWQKQKVFSGAHRAAISALAWSPNGALLVTAGIDKSLVLWDTRTQKILKTYDNVQNTILALDWHPTANVLSYTNDNGELFIREDFVPGEHTRLLRLSLQPAPLDNEPLSEISGNARRDGANGAKPGVHGFRSVEDDYLDDLLGPDAMSEEGADFIEDDDGAGYAEAPSLGKRRAADALDGPLTKRHALYSTWEPQIHAAFQPGSTPWKGNRRYLCLNLTGFVWTVNQDPHHTVTVEFYDRQEHRDFHFTDPYLYDKACLNSKGTLFSCPKSSQHPAILFYRPHETWTARTEWRTALPDNEEVTSMSLSESCVVATTSAGYVRVYSLFGVPLHVYRQKSTPAVTCASWRDYVLTVGNGPVIGNGTTQLVYTIANVKRDEVCQSEDTLPLPEDAELRSIFFSDTGDPCIYDTNGVLLILLHWRTPGQAKWVPLLDTRTLDRLTSGNKHETYWPVAVADNKFHCIILKGGEEYPYFPRPLLSDFEFKIPTSNPSSARDEARDAEDSHQKNLEEQYVRTVLQHSLVQDLVESTNATHVQKAEMTQMEREIDKTLIQLLAVECREGEERGMKALEIAALMRDRTGKMLEAAVKVASRFHRDILSEKINQLAERRLVGLVDDDGT
nr:minichromosome loss protein 1 [Quercus suber]